MKLPIICRTCDAKDTEKLYKLATATKRFPDKLLSEILTELTHIEVTFVTNLFLHHSNISNLSNRWTKHWDDSYHNACAAPVQEN